MKVVIQRVKSSEVEINSLTKKSINKGLLVLCGFEDSDTQDDLEWMSKKIVNLRVFDDSQGIMNLSVKEINGDIMIISQFTLHASTKKGNRPSYIKSAKPDISIPLYNNFINEVEKTLEKKTVTGEFGANMNISLVNSGPVTIIIDSKNKN